MANSTKSKSEGSAPGASRPSATGAKDKAEHSSATDAPKDDLARRTASPAAGPGSSKAVEKKADKPSAKSKARADESGDTPDKKGELNVSQIEDYLRDNPAAGQRSVVKRHFPLEEYPGDSQVRKDHVKAEKKIEKLVEELEEIRADGGDQVANSRVRNAIRALRV